MCNRASDVHWHQWLTCPQACVVHTAAYIDRLYCQQKEPFHNSHSWPTANQNPELWTAAALVHKPHYTNTSCCPWSTIEASYSHVNILLIMFTVKAGSSGRRLIGLGSFQYSKKTQTHLKHTLNPEASALNTLKWQLSQQTYTLQHQKASSKLVLVLWIHLEISYFTQNDVKHPAKQKRKLLHLISLNSVGVGQCSSAFFYRLAQQDSRTLFILVMNEIPSVHFWNFGFCFPECSSDFIQIKEYRWSSKN